MTRLDRSELTVVTALMDVGRHMLPASFRRDYADYLCALPTVLAIDRPLVVYADAAAEACVWRHRTPADTYVHRRTVADLEAGPGWAAVQTIRTSPDWLNQAAWLADSPQARLAAYNPLVMSKLPWLADVARLNPFGSQAFVWVDAGLGRTVPGALLQQALIAESLLAHLRRFLFLCFPYDGGREIHGFPREALARRAGGADPRWVARGGFFGGQGPFVQRARQIYDALLADTLAHGLMGTEESVFTLMGYLHPAIFERYRLEGNGLVWPFFHDVTKELPHAHD